MKSFNKEKVLFTISLLLVFIIGTFSYPYIFNVNSAAEADNNSLELTKSELKQLQEDNKQLSDKITASTTKANELEKQYNELQASNKVDIEKAVEIEKARQAIKGGSTSSEETAAQSTSGNKTFKDMEGIWYLKSEGFGEGDEGLTGFVEIILNSENSIKFISYSGEKDSPTIFSEILEFRESNKTTVYADSSSGDRLSFEFKNNDTIWYGYLGSEAYPLYRSTLGELEANYNRASL